MAKFTIPIDAQRWPGLAGPTVVRAEATTYASQENQVERNLQQSHYARLDCFDASNNFLGTATLSSGETLGTAYHSGTIEGMLDSAFGP